jgi:hypothetical protein
VRVHPFDSIFEMTKGPVGALGTPLGKKNNFNINLKKN